MKKVFFFFLFFFFSFFLSFLVCLRAWTFMYMDLFAFGKVREEPTFC